MPGAKKEMVSLAEALATNGLEDGFRARAAAGDSGDELLKWCRAKLAGQLVYYPANLRHLRGTLNCSGTQGGKRKKRGPKLLRVSSGVRHIPTYLKHSC